MNFVTFGTAFTNVFPVANSKNGGQLMTEHNIRCRETINVPQSIKYTVGPSYVHCADDFKVRWLSDDSGVVTTFSTLEVMPGRGIINGHYVETLSSMVVDILEANVKLKAEAKPMLKGKLAIGIRAFYATDATIAGTLLVENKDEMYQGMQLVVLPEDELITPLDSPTDSSKVTAHLRLATFTYSNNKITGIKNCDDAKCQNISAERIANIDNLLSETYVKKVGLNSKKIYAFAGKGTDPNTGKDTWEDVTDSLIVWDTTPQRTSDKPGYSQANFTTIGDNVFLVVPHKQVDGMEDADGNPEYYAPRSIQFPIASYTENTPGSVDKSYTAHIKELSEKVNEFRTMLKGKQILYIEQREPKDTLPRINAAWEIGDYILVGCDYTADSASNTVRPPATLYVIIPGLVKDLIFHSQVEDSDIPPTDLHGTCLVNITMDAGKREERPSTSGDSTTYPVFFEEDDGVRGIVGSDYCTVTYKDGDHYTVYYYAVAETGSRAWSDYVPLTGEIPLAQENVIGGFLNVSSDTMDAGYVYRDDYGRLRLIDYQLLRSGTLAYQLGDDITFPTGLTTEEVQNYFDEYVNQRVAFPSASKISTSNTPNMIDLYVYLSAEDSECVLNIADIDSRFNTSVHLHILGEANMNTVINIYDCQKLKIDNDIAGTPIINVFRTCLYYDPYVMNYIRECPRASDTFTGMKDISFWYERIEDTDPQLVVDNMTVSEINAPIVAEDVDYWKEEGPQANDNHYLTALHSITFCGDGTITGCELLLADNSTDNVDPGEKIVVGQFTLPQGSGLSYPKTCLNKQLKVTGTFVSAYYSDSSWYTTNTSFTVLTNAYDAYLMEETVKGTIAFHSVTTLIQADLGATSIPCWEPDTYHIFRGGAIN